MYTTNFSYRRRPSPRLWLAAILASILALFAWSAETDFALIMPKAGRSLLLDIAAAGERLVAVGERGHILYSEDGGSSWVQVKVPTSVMLTRVFFISDTTGWAVGHDGNILASSDGGLSWTLQRDGVSEQVYINEETVARARKRLAGLQQQLDTAEPEQRDELLTALEEAESALATALEVMDEPVYASPLMDIWFADEHQGWAAGAFGTLLHTANGGRSWQDIGYTLPNPEELHLNGVAGSAEGTLYLASEWGYVFRSDGGEAWEAMETGFEGSYFGVLVNPASGSVFAYGLLGTIYRSTDRGENWQQLESNTRSSLFGAVAAPDGTLLFVGQNGTVLTSQDDGDSFTVLDDGSRGLYGAAYLAPGRFVVTGDGGSEPLAGLAGAGG